MKRDLLIACLGDAIIGKLYVLDDNFDYEPDVEFGGFEALVKEPPPVFLYNGLELLVLVHPIVYGGAIHNKGGSHSGYIAIAFLGNLLESF